MAAGPAVIQANEGQATGGKLSPEDEQIMRQPYAEAVSFMGFSAILIVHAVKLLQKQNKPVKVEKLLTEVETLKRLQDRGEPLPSIDTKQAPGCSESEELDNSEHADARSANSRDELENDGEQAVMPARPRVFPQPQFSRKDEISQRTPEATAALRRKLAALRHENKKLKDGQMCRGCHNMPVSITFLPCGHYAYCYDCGQKFGACPVCQKVILADVRTFLA